MLVKHVHIDDRIRVAAIFENGRLKPVWFDLAGKRYDVKKLCLTWDYNTGRAVILNFAVWDGVNSYVLEFNSSNHIWSLSMSTIE